MRFIHRRIERTVVITPPPQIYYNTYPTDAPPCEYGTPHLKRYAVYRRTSPFDTLRAIFSSQNISRFVFGVMLFLFLIGLLMFIGGVASHVEGRAVTGGVIACLAGHQAFKYFPYL